MGPTGTLVAAADEVEAVALDGEAGGSGDLVERSVEALLDARREREVAHVATLGADEVVVMVVGEALGQFVTGMVVVGDDPHHRADLLEDRQVAIHTGLREPVVSHQDLRNRERSVRLVQCLDDLPTARRVAMVSRPQ